MGVDKYACFMQMNVYYYCNNPNIVQKILQNNAKNITWQTQAQQATTVLSLLKVYLM